MIDQKGKQLLICGILCIIFFAIEMLAGGTIIWKNFRADQLVIKKKIMQIEKDDRLAKELDRILSIFLKENLTKGGDKE